MPTKARAPLPPRLHQIPHALDVDVQPLNFLIQGRQGDSQALGGFGLVPAAFFALFAWGCYELEEKSKRFRLQYVLGFFLAASGVALVYFAWDMFYSMFHLLNSVFDYLF